MILDDEDILIKNVSNICRDPIKLLFDCYDDKLSSLDLLNQYINIEGLKWEESDPYYLLVDNKDEIYCEILKDSYGVGSINITTYTSNEEYKNKLHNIFTTLDMIYFKIADPSKGFWYVRYDLHDTCYNPKRFKI